MKKVILIAAMSLTLAATMNVSQAANFIKPSSKNFDACMALTNGGWGSHFITADQTMDASLFYNDKQGEGVSGGFGAITENEHRDAPLIESTCKWGAVTLNWNQAGFNGKMTGEIDLENGRITNVNAIVNGVEKHNDMIFIGYK